MERRKAIKNIKLAPTKYITVPVDPDISAGCHYRQKADIEYYERRKQ